MGISLWSDQKSFFNQFWKFSNSQHPKWVDPLSFESLVCIGFHTLHDYKQLYLLWQISVFWHFAIQVYGRKDGLSFLCFKSALGAFAKHIPNEIMSGRFSYTTWLQTALFTLKDFCVLTFCHSGLCQIKQLSCLTYCTFMDSKVMPVIDVNQLSYTTASKEKMRR